MHISKESSFRDAPSGADPESGDYRTRFRVRRCATPRN